MSGNTERFTGHVVEYVQYRERYDAKIVLPLLHEWCGLGPAWRVADVGAGTGMLSDVFLANGNRVIAVEPNAEMREACVALHAGDPRLSVVQGTAEGTGLPDASVEMVSVGRALHWFDLAKTMPEFRRVLKPGGWVGVIACGRTKDGREENIALEQVLRDFSAEGKDTHANYGVYDQLAEFFVGGQFHRKDTRGEMRLGWEEFRGMVLSLSHAPLQNDVRFAEFELALQDCFDRFAEEDVMVLATRHWVNAGQF